MRVSFLDTIKIDIKIPKSKEIVLFLTYKCKYFIFLKKRKIKNEIKGALLKRVNTISKEDDISTIESFLKRVESEDILNTVLIEELVKKLSLKYIRQEDWFVGFKNIENVFDVSGDYKQLIDKKQKQERKIKQYNSEKRLLLKEISNYKNNSFIKKTQELTLKERSKSPKRTKVINHLISFLNRETTYLEIGVRNPKDNFNNIIATKKYSVDPGIEFEDNPVDFKMTSDEFFKSFYKKDILNGVKFDVIFIDGLHISNQVERDIENSLKCLKEDGFIVLHDCNPPTEWHARECFNYKLSPAGDAWNGTTWKAFVKYRANTNLYSCCVDTDWGVGIISKSKNLGLPLKLGSNFFYEYSDLDLNRQKMINLLSFAEFKGKL